LHQNAVADTRPEVSQAQQAFDDVEGVLNVPALGVQGPADFGREAAWVSHVGQITLPLAMPSAMNHPAASGEVSDKEYFLSCAASREECTRRRFKQAHTLLAVLADGSQLKQTVMHGSALA
jgi:hypothetical protein